MTPPLNTSADMAVQAVELRMRTGEAVPWDAVAPLLPFAASLLVRLGLPPAAATSVAAAALFAVSAAGLMYLCSQWRGPSRGWVSSLGLLTPLRLGAWLVWFDWEWLAFSSCLVMALAAERALRSRPVLRWIGASAGMLAVVGSLPLGAPLLALAAVGELAVAAVLAGSAARGRSWPVLAGFAGVSLIVLGIPAATRAGAFPAASPPAQLLSVVAERQPAPVVGPRGVDEFRYPYHAQASALIRSDARREESLWWVDALGARYLLSMQAAKYRDAFECIAEAEGWCVYWAPGPEPAPAALVSRRLLELLPPVRGVYDLAWLEAYVQWARRPEAVAFERDESDPRRIMLRVNAGEDDLVLIRQPFAGTVTAARGDGQTLAVESDPLGFTVVDPRGPYEGAIVVEDSADGRYLWAADRRAPPLPGVDVPQVTPGGVVNAESFQSAPLARGDWVSIYGRRFDPGASSVSIGGTPAEVTFAGAHQINARVPGGLAPGAQPLVVGARGVQSMPAWVEIAP